MRARLDWDCAGVAGLADRRRRPKQGSRPQGEGACVERGAVRLCGTTTEEGGPDVGCARAGWASDVPSAVGVCTHDDVWAAGEDWQLGKNPTEAEQ